MTHICQFNLKEKNNWQRWKIGLTMHRIDIFLWETLCPRRNLFSVSDRIEFGEFIDTGYCECKTITKNSNQLIRYSFSLCRNLTLCLLFSGHVSGEPGSNFSMLIKLTFSLSSVKWIQAFNMQQLYAKYCNDSFRMKPFANVLNVHATPFIVFTFFDWHIGNGFIVIDLRHTHCFWLIDFNSMQQLKLK